MDSDGNSQVSASTKWLALAEPTCNWQLSMSVHGDINVLYSHVYELILYDCHRDPYTISKVSAKYQFCAIHTEDNTDGKNMIFFLFGYTYKKYTIMVIVQR